jgi:hypothetical protein
MPRRSRDLKRVAGYFPVVVFEQLEKRAAKNFNSVSNELVRVIAEALQGNTAARAAYCFFE